MQQVLRENPEVLIMDCTYKTNKYKMPLLIITGVTCLNTSFFAAFCFMKGESYGDYRWVLEALQRLYDHLDLPYPSVILSDGDKALASAILHVFGRRAFGGGLGNVHHALCVWHINNNFTEHCKKYFKTVQQWEPCLAEWKRLYQCSTISELEEEYQRFYMKYIEVDVHIGLYIEEHIWPQRQKWAKCYTNKILHFDNITTSRGEGGHRVVKERLQFSTGDLHTVLGKLERLLIDQHHNYNGKIEEAKARLPKKLRNRPFMRDLTAYVSPKALNLVVDQYLRVSAQPTAIVACTGTFTATMGLPCAHRIQECLYDQASGRILKLEDIHPHWRFVKPPRPATGAAEGQEEVNTHGGDDEATKVERTPSSPKDILRIQEPAVVKAKGRPLGALNKAWTGTSQRSTTSQRRQQAFEDSTQREPSGFEYAQTQIPDSQPPQPIQSRRGGLGSRQRGGRGAGGATARGGASNSQIRGIPSFYMGTFQM